MTLVGIGGEGQFSTFGLLPRIPATNDVTLSDCTLSRVLDVILSNCTLPRVLEAHELGANRHCVLCTRNPAIRSC
jgi:hypothetical protein